MTIKDILEKNSISYESIEHRPTYNAQRMAGELHVSGYNVGKTILLKLDEGKSWAVGVLAAPFLIDPVKLKEAFDCDSVEAASEYELQEKFPEEERGVVSPFGSSYGFRTVIDSSLTKDEFVLFEGDRHDEAIKVKLDDYMKAEKPQVGDIGIGPKKHRSFRQAPQVRS